MVTFVKTAARNDAVLPDGSIYAPDVLRALDRKAWFEKHGALSQSLVDAIASRLFGEGDPWVPVGVSFDPLADMDGLEEASRSTDASMRREGERALGAAIATRRKELLPAWEAAGLVTTQVQDSIPIVFGEVRLSQLDALARRPEVVSVINDFEGEATPMAAPNSMSDPGIDTKLNVGAGLVGEGQSLGMITVHNCGVFRSHEAFQLVPGGIQYSNTPRACTTAADCDGYCAPGMLDIACGGGTCMSKHDNSVLSAAIASRGGAAWGAAKSKAYVFNGPNAACSPMNAVTAYTYFTANAVSTVINTTGCSPLNNDIGSVIDWFARKNQVLTVEASGDTPHCTGGTGPLCVACPGTLNALCVGGSTPGGAAASAVAISTNPDSKVDREEPDLVALDENVDVADVTGPTAWTTNSGTSFSAPTVAAFAALVKEGCSSWSVANDEVGTRALLQASTYTRNPDGTRYSTQYWLPAPVDQKDGSGAIDATTPLYFCTPGGSGPPTFHFGGLIDLGSGGGPAPTGKAGGNLGKAPLSHAVPDSLDAWLYAKMADVGSVTAGQRIRFALTWDSCPTAATSTVPPSIATDFDLFLFDTESTLWVYGSQSVSDNSEGFDVKAPSTSKYAIYLRWPKGAKGCNNTGNEYVIGAGVLP